MNRINRGLVSIMLVGSIFMTGCDAGQILDVISKVAEGVQKAMPAVKEVINTISSALGKNDGNGQTTTNQTASPTAPVTQETDANNDNASVVVTTPSDDEEITARTNTATETETATETATAAETQTTTSTATSTATQVAEPTNDTGTPVISTGGKNQMSAVVDYAKANNRGASAGQCFNAVWGYLTTCGYGNLDDWNDLPNMGSDEARNFAEFLNESQANLDEAGLQRLDTAFNPPITSPHDPRIPEGAVIVVAAGSYGTAHPTAGDIVIKAGDGVFINDGPNMDYGTSDSWTGQVLGVYVPK